MAYPPPYPDDYNLRPRGLHKTCLLAPHAPARHESYAREPEPAPEPAPDPAPASLFVDETCTTASETRRERHAVEGWCVVC
ncbi:hypothetical protein PMIN01_11403 [Paraphaeosphaeria minitans]|uniref:Uncharacterized protein n=1 Tax=Paraphaeosphaeria minitans TaxID=565426 RepID=A0A9P6GA89_9PLEO|nr:hypothetical protein PMIN01_11403 [Paraphaeosphaeria minitans]